MSIRRPPPQQLEGAVERVRIVEEPLPQRRQGAEVPELQVREGDAAIPIRSLDADRVLFGKYSGSEVQIDGEEHLIIREEDVLGVIEKK